MEEGSPISIKIVAEIIDHLHQLLALTRFVKEVVEIGVELDDPIVILVPQAFSDSSIFFSRAAILSGVI
jgi:hypothetical protein